MPPQLTYPGVYIQEIPSGVRAITGVATSIAAFVGWTPRGPVDRAGQVFSRSDYDRAFGGLHRDSAVSYAVAHFFDAGGQQAYVIRLADPAATPATLTVDDLTLTATGPGVWAREYGVDIRTRDVDGGQRFGLTVFRRPSANAEKQIVEVFENLSLDETDARFVESVLNDESGILNAEAAGTGVSDTPEQGAMLQGGDDGAVLRPGDPDFWTQLWEPAVDDDGHRGGVHHLCRIDLFNLLVVPGFTDRPNLATLARFCHDNRAFLIADGENTLNEQGVEPVGGDLAINAALYYPWVRMSDPLQEGRVRPFPPSGVVAGIYARTDTTRGVWKAPAGIDASLATARGLANVLTDAESGQLNRKGVNALRTFPIYGSVIWGARTCRGNDEIGSEWKYVPVRRTALFIEETLRRNLKWVVFEPNDEPLWAQIRLNVGAFMHDQFRKGAFQGASPREAYFVKCDKDTTTQNDINLGIVNILVGFAPLRPAEFVVVTLQQIAGQVQA